MLGETGGAVVFPFITRKLDGRLYEWAVATPTLGLSIQMMIWPNMMETSAFQWITVLMSPEMIAFIFATTGAMRLFALIVNGSSDLFGPVARSICAFLSAIMWGQFAYALYLLGVERGVPSPGLLFWISFSAAEVFVCYRALFDVRRFSR